MKNGLYIRIIHRLRALTKPRIYGIKSENTGISKERVMIITKTPFRMSFCGGGSDLPSFYEQYNGCVLSASINKYMYITIHPYFDPHKTVLKYSKTETVDELYQIEHPIFHYILNEFHIDGVEITCTADIPSGTGLGSSSTFTVGLLNTLFCYLGKYVSKHELAARACVVEIEKLGAPIGKQDQFAAALGGLNFIRFHQNGEVTHEPVIISRETIKRLEAGLCLFYMGEVRSANKILSEQNQNMRDKSKTDNLIQMCRLTYDMKEALQKGDLSAFGEILNENWRLKRGLATGVTNSRIDEIYEKAIKAGAGGGKLLGAGGGGFFLFYCDEDKQATLNAALNLRRMPFAFEHDGASIVYIGDKYWGE